MKAIIFSAGKGTRLYPLTDNLPKALAPFNGSTLLKYNIEFLKSFGIRKFLINTHHFPDKIQAFIDDLKFNDIEINLSFEPDLLETAGTLAKNYDYFKDEKHLLCFNVDIVTNIDISKLIQYHFNSNNDVTLAVSNRTSSRKLVFDRNKFLCGWKNHMTGESILFGNSENSIEKSFSGISLVNTDIIPLIGGIQKKSLTNFFLEICQNKKIGFYDHSETYWFDCGSIAKLEEAQKFITNTLL